MEGLPDIDEVITLPSGERKRFGDCSAEDVRALMEQREEAIRSLEFGTDPEDEMGYPGTL